MRVGVRVRVRFNAHPKGFCILHRFKPKNTTEKLIFREIYSIITNSQNIRRVGETSRVGENLGG